MRISNLEDLLMADGSAVCIPFGDERWPCCAESSSTGCLGNSSKD